MYADIWRCVLCEGWEVDGRTWDIGVYVVSTPDGHVKIGHTARSIRGRVSTLQTGSPQELELVAVFPTDGDFKEIERALHWALSLARSQGEWFRLTPAVRDMFVNDFAISDLCLPSINRDYDPAKESLIKQQIERYFDEYGRPDIVFDVCDSCLDSYGQREAESLFRRFVGDESYLHLLEDARSDGDDTIFGFRSSG